MRTKTHKYVSRALSCGMSSSDGPFLQPDAEQPWAVLERAELCAAPPIVRDRLRLHGGEESYVYRPRGGRAALVVPVTPSGEIVLLRQYRYPLRATLTEIVAGGVELGETPRQAAARELREEVGGAALEWLALPTFCPQPSFTGQVFHPFVALGVTLGEASPEAGELIEVQVVPAREVYRRLDGGELPNAPSALTLFYARPALLERGLL